MMAPTRLPPPKHPGVTVGTIVDEDEAKAWWFCDDMEKCRFLLRLDVPAMVESHGRDAMMDDVIADDAQCPKCGGTGHMTIIRKLDPAKERRNSIWIIAGLLAAAVFMFFGAFYNYDQMASGGRFRPMQLIVCLPVGCAMLYFAWEVWKGIRAERSP